MTYIPIDNKVSLINKYVQINILRNKGQALHVDIPENEIFSAIIDDLKAYDETIAKPENLLEPVIDSLKLYQERQADMRFHLNALMHTLETVRDEESQQINLESIIKKLKDLDQR